MIRTVKYTRYHNTEERKKLRDVILLCSISISVQYCAFRYVFFILSFSSTSNSYGKSFLNCLDFAIKEAITSGRHICTVEEDLKHTPI